MFKYYDRDTNYSLNNVTYSPENSENAKKK